MPAAVIGQGLTMLTRISGLSTARLAIRPVAAGDIADLMAVNGDPVVTQFLPYATWNTEADGHAWLQRMEAIEAAGAARQLVIVHGASAKAVGTVLLFRHDEGSARVELGYVLGRAHWQQGLMREALLAVLGHAFTALAIRRIEAEVAPANAASNALLRSLGFTHEGLLRQRWVSKGEAHDVNIHGLLASEWPAR